MFKCIIVKLIFCIIIPISLKCILIDRMNVVNVTKGDGHVIRRYLAYHYNNVIMSAMASQITSLTVVYSSVYSGAHQRKHQSSASLAFMRGIHRLPVNSSHKGPVTRKMFPFDKNTERHTAHTIVSWPNPKQWVSVHTSDLMMIIRQIIYILSIITWEMGKLKTHSPTYCIMDNWENMASYSHTRQNISDWDFINTMSSDKFAQWW